MKKYIYAVIITCLGVILLGLNVKTHQPIKDVSTSPQKPLQATIEPKVDTEPQTPVETILEPVQEPTPPAPVYAPVSEDEAKNFIYQHESSGRLDAMNSIGACGLGQSLPCSKLESVCPDWRTNYECQDAWFTNYMLARYGSWDNARAWWLQNRWW